MSADAGGRSPLLEVRGLTKRFPLRRGERGAGPAGARGLVHAVEDVSFDVASGETLALVGESGSGKTTVGRSLLRLIEPTAGSARYHPAAGPPVELFTLPPRALRPLRRELQVVFQDPYGSLNPRMSVGEIIGEGLRAHGLRSAAERARRVAEVLERVELPRAAAARFPHAFSGGQRQRIGIARALVLEPRFVVLDEATSALDVSIQAQILNLLADLRAERGLAYLFIAHDLSVVRHLADRVAVLYLGRLMEVGTRAEVFGAPAHPYTRALLDAAPATDPMQKKDRIPLGGEVPSALDPPSGCVFRTRCPLAEERCALHEPRPRSSSPTHWAACHLLEDGPATGPRNPPPTSETA